MTVRRSPLTYSFPLLEEAWLWKLFSMTLVATKKESLCMINLSGMLGTPQETSPQLRVANTATQSNVRHLFLQLTVMGKFLDHEFKFPFHSELLSSE